MPIENNVYKLKHNFNFKTNIFSTHTKQILNMQKKKNTFKPLAILYSQIYIYICVCVW